MTLEVRRPGALSTLQDRGRQGYQRLGVLVGGAMDEWSHRLANALVGNDDDAASLEMVLSGPSLVATSTVLVAVCGADLAPTVAFADVSEPLPQGQPVWLRAGARLDFGASRSGMHAYLAVRGGFDVPPVMGSRSTYLRGGFGGLAGRALTAGDRLPVGSLQVAVPDAAAFEDSLSGAIQVPPSPIVVAPVAPPAVATVRVIAGAQQSAFTDAARDRLFSAEYRIGLQSDRMGYRLDGPALERRDSSEMISEAVTVGTIQVPPDGRPIILMADRQTSGGYPKIGDVASADLRILAQLPPRHRLRFEPITLADAQRILLAREREYSHVRQVMNAEMNPADEARKARTDDQ